METAVKAQLPQSQFDASDPYDKAYMIAYWRTHRKMSAWENHLQNEAMKKATIHLDAT